MSGRTTAQKVPLGTAIKNLFQARKQDFFFVGIAVFALGIVARQEMMRKGIIAPPVRESADVTPKIERKRKHREE